MSDTREAVARAIVSAEGCNHGMECWCAEADAAIAAYEANPPEWLRNLIHAAHQTACEHPAGVWSGAVIDAIASLPEGLLTTLDREAS